jgi:hypothetical protein
LHYEKPIATGAQAKISIGSFLPFSTASANFCLTHRSKGSLIFFSQTTPRAVTDVLIKFFHASLSRQPDACGFRRAPSEL